MTLSHQELAARVTEAGNVGPRDGFDSWAALVTDDYEEFLPQSGERIRGRENNRAYRMNYPGGLENAPLDGGSQRTAGAENDQYFLTQLFTVVKVQEHGDHGTTVLRATYPDKSVWWVVVLYERRGDQMSGATTYFAPVFEAPAWRSQWVEVGEPSVAPPLPPDSRLPATVSNQQLFESVVDAMNEADFDQLDHIFGDAFIETYPQSGELVRGRANARAIRENYPGGFQKGAQERETATISGDAEHWDITPMYTMVRHEEYGREGTVTLRVRYPDGSVWWLAILYERQGDQIGRATNF